MKALFYSHIEKDDRNSSIIERIEKYSNDHKVQIYLINKPLSDEKYSYGYENNALVLLSPKHKIIFLGLVDDEIKFDEYCDDFIEDLGSISDKFDYKEFIGRPKTWEKELVVKKVIGANFDIEVLLDENIIASEDKNLQRKCELLISLLVGSINDLSLIGADEPETLLEKVKNKIVLFDGEQTRFIYQNNQDKQTYIQGLSGTGKTELLLHKLKEIYTSTENTKIFFTCHNKILAYNIRERIPKFFNFMKVEKQIEWNERLWVVNAWGSENDYDTGVYTYICNFYNIPFYRFNRLNMDFDKACKLAIKEIEKIEKANFNHAIDYVLIDESQDFPQSFFDLCAKVTSKKTYIAGDIFQNIFEDNFEKRIVNADFVLNKCYRTDPRTLMFAQAIGMGLFEKTKLNWLSKKEWEGSGYILSKKDNEISLYREPVRRFEDLETENISSMILIKNKFDMTKKVIEIISALKAENKTISPDDIAIILLDNEEYIYELADKLEIEILNHFEWTSNKGYESKEKSEDAVFISNRNNVKGLEFPFVICISRKLKNSLKYRNTLYTMLTRSFIQSYLIFDELVQYKELSEGLKIINKENRIKTTEPTLEEIKRIKSTIIKVKKEANISYKDLLTQIFDDLNINKKCRAKLEKAISEALVDKFDKDLIIEFINANKKFYCQ